MVVPVCAASPDDRMYPDNEPAEALYGDMLGAGAMVGSHVIERMRSPGGFGAVYQAIGGDLLELDAWATGGAPVQVEITAAAADGLTAEIAALRSGLEGRCAVTRRITP